MKTEYITINECAKTEKVRTMYGTFTQRPETIRKIFRKIGGKLRLINGLERLSVTEEQLNNWNRTYDIQ